MFIRHIALVLIAGIFLPLLGCASLPGADKHAKVMRFSKNPNKHRKKASKIESNNKLAVKTTKEWSVLDLFRNEQKQMELKCPDKNSRKKKEKDIKYVATEEYDDYQATPDVLINTAVEEIHFDIIKLSENKLEIPAFKQFKNNMTDFTADGEEEFKTIISKIRDFLGDNTDGKGVTLKIIGSASQIPTSFDPTKPNNNIQANGSSIPGQTSIDNNKLLAQARATELAKKIQLVFGNITIITPELSDIQLGATPWDWRAQRDLNEAIHSEKQGAVDAVFAPFQKEQFVQVESEEVHAKTVKPKSIKMYTVSMTPKVYFKDHTMQTFIDAQFVVSKETYDLIGGSRRFESVDDRAAFLKSHNLEIQYSEKYGFKRWYIVQAGIEKQTMSMANDYDRIYQQYLVGLVDNLDKKVLRKIITEKYLKMANGVVSK